MVRSASKIILIYITASSKNEARRLAKALLSKKFIACANIFKIGSLYWWKGKITDCAEWVMIAKTLESNFVKVKKEIEKIHSYEIPCVIKIPAAANEKYFNWMTKELKRK